MSNYEHFAKFYDTMMEEVPYRKWTRYLIDIFKKYKIEPEIILDLGCGTGKLTELLAEEGYSMIGIDISEDMLAIAKEKAELSSFDTLYLCQNMVEFELYGTVEAVISTCDSLNYITNKEDVLKVFKLVNNYLDPGGLFVFDLNTKYKFDHVLGNRVFGDTNEEYAYIWDNYFYEEENINEYHLTFFVKNENGMYDRFEETHYEKAYAIHEIEEMLELAGLKLEGVFKEGTYEKPDEQTERIYYVAREIEKVRDETKY